MSKKKLTQACFAITFLAAIFITGLFFGRDQSPEDGFTVSVQNPTVSTEALETAPLPIDRLTNNNPDTQTEEVLLEDEIENEENERDVFPININTASEEELMALPGIGPVIAARIVAHREYHGEFRFIQELTDVAGIGTARFSAIETLVIIH